MPPLKPQTILLVLFLLAAFAAGFFAGRLTTRPQITSLSTASSSKTSPLFQSQSATTQSQVTKIDGDLITLTDSAGNSGQFPAVSNVVVSKYSGKSGVASLSAGLASIELNKSAQIIFIYKDGEFKINSISFLPSPEFKPVTSKK